MIRIEDSIAYQIYIAARHLRRQFLAMGRKHDIDLHQEQWFILNKLRRGPGQSQIELTDFFGDRPTMTRALQSLEKRKLLCRISDPEDARIKKVFLTKKGERLHDDFADITAKARTELFTGISEKEMQTFHLVIDKLKQALGDQGG
ncbi:MAG: MarR family transcriptional regulator [Leptospiraceae bacterium]|nr:MarR family transcriptional regulator [Leptospiraceae bacterium]